MVEVLLLEGLRVSFPLTLAPCARLNRGDLDSVFVLLFVPGVHEWSLGARPLERGRRVLLLFLVLEEVPEIAGPGSGAIRELLFPKAGAFEAFLRSQNDLPILFFVKRESSLKVVELYRAFRVGLIRRVPDGGSLNIFERPSFPLHLV